MQRDVCRPQTHTHTHTHTHPPSLLASPHLHACLQAAVDKAQDAELRAASAEQRCKAAEVRLLRLCWPFPTAKESRAGLWRMTGQQAAYGRAKVVCMAAFEATELGLAGLVLRPAFCGSATTHAGSACPSMCPCHNQLHCVAGTQGTCMLSLCMEAKQAGKSSSSGAFMQGKRSAAGIA